MKDNMRVHYDEEGDFLEISRGKPTSCYADEIKPGIFLRKDEATDEVKSIGILGFKKRIQKGKDGEVSIPVKITLHAEKI
ncbi:TPA: DUF2283 domain-containing protein [Candidatus Woesearchaeota archaeon]|nr:DUF2283 domain-containing protein [Candidatus Woesearchaeota archaeon]